jgi:hypothetical protein
VVESVCDGRRVKKKLVARDEIRATGLVTEGRAQPALWEFGFCELYQRYHFPFAFYFKPLYCEVCHTVRKVCKG